MNKKRLPTHLVIDNPATGLKRPSIAQCEGSRIISKSDICGKLGSLDNSTMKKIATCWLINNPLIAFFSEDELIELYKVLIESNMNSRKS